MNESTWILENLLLAEKMLEREEYVRAKRILDEILETEPGYGRAHNHLGWIFYSVLDDHKMAERHYRLAIHFEPSYPHAYMNLLRLLIANGQYEEARNHAMHMLSSTTVNRSLIYNELGRIEELCGNYKRSIDHYNQAICHCVVTMHITAYSENIKRVREKRLMNRRSLLF